MSSMNIKQGSDAHFPEYPLASPSNNEIDLLNLIEVLWRAKKTVMAVVFAFACAGLLISFILPQKWTSAAVVTPPEPVQWQALEKTFTKLRVLDLDIKIDRTEAFNLFIKKFQSVSLLEEYLRSTPYVMDQLKEAKIDELDLHRAIVALSEKMKAVDDNASKKKDEPSLYTSWTLSFTAPTSEEAQTVLSGYIDSSVINWRSKPSLKKKNWLRTALKRKINLMQTFSASIIHSTLLTRQELKSPFTVMVRPLKMTPISLFLSAQTVLNANWKLKKRLLTLRN